MSVRKTQPVKDFRTEIPGNIDSEDLTTYVFPEIISKNKHGKNTHWQIIVRLLDESTGKFMQIKDEYYSGESLPKGIVGWIKVNSWNKSADDIRKSAPTLVTSGKNLKKVNKTNVFTQALRDAYGKYTAQLQKSHLEDLTHEGAKLFPPMLAQNLNSQKSPVNYKNNVYVQPKYNGVRVVATESAKSSAGKSAEIIMYSRKMKLYYGFSYIREELNKIIRWFDSTHKMKIYIDGEMYLPDMSLQDISGIVRTESEHEGAKLNYYVFDCFFPTRADMKYSQRLEYIREIAEHFGPTLKYIKFTPTHRVESREETDKYFQKYLREGLEGAILRLDREYVYSYNEYHTPYLLKMKPVLDDEFRIIDYTCATQGESAGALMFILQTKEGRTFPINLGVELDKRKELYKKMSAIEPNGKTHFENNYMGKMLVVLFDEWSKDRVPLRARTDGIVIRDYEER